MAWTYSENPASTPKDAVRFLVGDTISTDPLASDEELVWALSLNSNIYAAASIIADSIATKFATMKVSVRIGPISEEYGNRATFYANRAKELKNKASDNSTLNIDSCLPVNVDGSEKEPSFSIGMTDNV